MKLLCSIGLSLALALAATPDAWARLSLGGGLKLQGELPYWVLTMQHDNTVAELAWARAGGRVQGPGLTLSTRAALFAASIRWQLPLPAPASVYLALGGIRTLSQAQGAYGGQPINVNLEQEGIQAGAGVEFASPQGPWRAYGGVLYTLLPLKTLALRAQDGQMLNVQLPVPGTSSWSWNLGLRLDFSLDTLLGR